MDRVEDQISELPDDILVSLISLIGLKEAAKTSILSKRWRYLWTKQTHLDFNHSVVLPDLNPDVRKFIPSVDEMSKYINWVNQVIDVHCSPCIDTFKVSFIFDKSLTHHIHKWMRFAILKKVKDLVLDLTSYPTGFDILQPSLSPGDGDISFLTSLHLVGVDVNGDVLESLLSRCHLLERAHIAFSLTLVRLKVIGESCKLKQLTLNFCSSLKELEIDSANLMYIDISGAKYDLRLLIKSAPMLVEVKVGGWNESNSILPPFFQIAGQISKLSLGLLRNGRPCGLLPTLPTFSHLKQLNLLIVCEDIHIDHHAVVLIATLLGACPVVCEMKLEIRWWTNLLPLKLNLTPVDNVVPPRKTHRNLKLLHVAGFNGYDKDVNLILYFVDVASNLETIIFDSTSYLHDQPEIPVPVTAATRFAKLKNIVPPKIHVQMI